MRWKLLLFLAFGICVAWLSQHTSEAQTKSQYRDWRQFGGGAENIHYTTLDQINKKNVSQLQVAWTYDSGDQFNGSEIQCNPIIVDGVLYATTPKLKAIALDAATGKVKWSFDPNEGNRSFGKMRNRGVTYWADGNDKRIYFGFRHWLFAIDATSGKSVTTFGDGGKIDLREGLGRPPQGLSLSNTTPAVVYKDLLIVGFLTSEALPSAPGDIRAFDARTGKQRWSFHTIPHPGEFGYETNPPDGWKYLGGANNWPGMVLDQKRGLVFVPTGSLAFDFYGANRHGDNLFANTLLCLDANTGTRKWHFQAVKHDVWDRDFPSAPQLVTLKRDGKTIDAVAQMTKSGHVYVFERETGKSLFPLEEKQYPASSVDGEQLAKTQTLPTSPPAFARQTLTEDMLTQRTPEAHKFALEKFRASKSNGQFEPPSKEGTIVFPGFDGAGEWGGAAFDPETNLYYVNSNEMAWILRIVDRPKIEANMSGKTIYEANCASCHKKDLTGTPPEFPSLVDIGKKLSDSELRGIIRSGLGRMSAFPDLSRGEMAALSQFLLTGESGLSGTDHRDAPNPMELKYTSDGYNKFLDHEGYPAIAPPWGTLNAIDLNKGVIKWQIPFGEFPKLVAQGVRNTGSENYGGGIVTKNGLFFIGATNYDQKFRAFDKLTGKLLWETILPAAGNATPATYEVNGRQFIVIAAGGGKGSASGGSYVAFALPVKSK